MSDNIQLNSGSGGATLATDAVGGAHYQIVKLAYGEPDSATVVAPSAPLPICDGGGSVTVDGSVVVNGAVTVEAASLDVRALDAGDDSVAAVQSGTWNIANVTGAISLPTGAATEATLSALDAKVAACDTGSVAGTVTANAGTNLNTSALALESGGNLAALAGAVSGGRMQVEAASLPARTATADSMVAKLATDTIHNGSTPLVPKFANIGAAASGNNALVAAATGKKLRLLAIALIATGEVNLYFNDGTAELFADSSNSVPLDATGSNGTGGFVLGFNPLGWFETADVNRPLNVHLSAAVGVCGSLVYVEV